MAKVKYLGVSHERILSTEDLALLGVQDHAPLTWDRDNFCIVEVDDAVAEVLTTTWPREMVLMVESGLEEPAEGAVEEAALPPEKPKGKSKPADQESAQTP